MTPIHPFRSLAVLTSLVLGLPALGAGGTRPPVHPGSAPEHIAKTAAHSAKPAAPAGTEAITAAARAAGLRGSVLRLALQAHARATAEGLTDRSILTVIDYSLPSHQRRLWVLDLAAGQVLAREFVAHGRGTGQDIATRFSNRPGSFATSLGTFITAGTYRGKHGLSLRLRGLDEGLNDNALTRAIVVHGAWYVSRDMIRRYGRLGRSEGCPALSEAAAPRIIDLIRGHTVVFAYHPSARLQERLTTS